MGVHPPPPLPAWANFTLKMECTPESNCCFSVYGTLWEGLQQHIYLVWLQLFLQGDCVQQVVLFTPLKYHILPPSPPPPQFKVSILDCLPLQFCFSFHCIVSVPALCKMDFCVHTQIHSWDVTSNSINFNTVKCCGLCRLIEHC